MTSNLSKDEIVFCINCIQANYPGIWSDTPEKLKELLFDIYDENVDLSTVKELCDQRIIEEDEYAIAFSNYGYR